MSGIEVAGGAKSILLRERRMWLVVFLVYLCDAMLVEGT